MSAISPVESEEHYAELTGADKITVVLFSAPWCGQCKLITPKLNKLAKEASDKVAYVKVDTTVLEDLAVDLGVSALPSVKIYSKGQVIGEYVGSKWEKIEELVQAKTS
ncbi:hypothetical protein H257_10735 [Aphanomyces astaci]|uniref:Thioredoxin n=2 Tax=Aphanomyces astaci TaxID=112090 RepID=W4G6D6_APHAT|nr:hypothetical protein H257_10735 [Aphanomyces astaci]ETV74594.1 hypothetical protein H257_10735 [Aphanomyces astaci]RHY76918.1 hypothetical protein DYB30_010270 [Aphanomyces astaci]|eukprot:XP_009835681.1 hypothetical protein H257_10735 [Aphanomyces astaci]